MAGALLLCCFINSLFFSSAQIHDRLRYFETLKSSDISHRVRRSLDPDPLSHSHSTEIQLNTLGRKFHLFLKPSKILSTKFKASIVGRNGKSVPFNVNQGALFSGKLAGDDGAVAEVNYEEDGTILGSIVTELDTYIIEPSWRHLPNSENHTMVAYRKSDVKFENADNGDHLHSTCGIKEGPGHHSLNDAELHGRVIVDDSHNNHESHRSKRQSKYLGSKNTCTLMVVADYTFFEHMGGKSASATALYMIHIIQFINTIYRQTQMDVSGGSMSDIGFEIKEMRIHNESFPKDTKMQTRTHYNIHENNWDVKNLLEAFSLDRYFDNFCLAHLFTYRSFSSGVLGLAYIASPRMAAVGGICSPLYPKYPRVRMSLNTGWSSSQNAGGHRILALQAQLVTSHELGHNMGSEHDPETDDCAPSQRDEGGKYIMYPWAVSGYDRNNQLFSPCSREYMFKVAKSKGYSCFVAGRGDEKFCGNGRIDDGETCDAGWDTDKNLDACCDSTCQLRNRMQCSPMNFGCCSAMCRPSPKDTVCRPALPALCQDEVQCDGNSFTCPNAKKTNIWDGQSCIDQGICKGGNCLNFCEVFNNTYKPCICANETACYRCCQLKSGKGACESINNTLLPDGRPCFQGICNQGICEKKRQDMVQRLYKLIENLSVDRLVAFMRSNIVGTVIVISLLLWIPTSCTISFIDKKNAKKEQAKRNWLSRSNRTLFTEEESSRIRRIPNQRIPRSTALNASMRSGNVSRPQDTPQPTTQDWPKSHVPMMYPAHSIHWPPAEPRPGRDHIGLETRGHRPQESLGFDIYQRNVGPDTETVV